MDREGRRGREGGREETEQYHHRVEEDDTISVYNLVHTYKYMWTLIVT